MKLSLNEQSVSNAETSKASLEAQALSMSGLDSVPIFWIRMFQILGIFLSLISLFSIWKFGFFEVVAPTFNIFVKSIFCFALAFAAVPCVLWLICCPVWLTRPSRIKVFVAYHHSHLELARDIANLIGRKDIVTDIIDQSSIEHDHLIDRVKLSIRQADVVVVLPSNDDGFYRSEVFTFSYLQKPIIFLATSEPFRTPPVAYEGYPVLVANRLAKSEYEPLLQLIRLAAITRTSVTDAARESLRSSLLGMFVMLLVAGPILGLVDLSLRLVVAVVCWGTPAGNAALFIHGMFGMVVLIAGFAAITLWLLLCNFRNLMLVRRIIRQRILTNTLTNEILRSYLFDLGHLKIGEYLLDERAQ